MTKECLVEVSPAMGTALITTPSGERFTYRKEDGLLDASNINGGAWLQPGLSDQVGKPIKIFHVEDEFPFTRTVDEILRLFENPKEEQ